MPYRRTPQIQLRLDGQRRALVTAAVDLVAEGGYRACTVAAVAARAGLSAGSLYNHFGDKSDLLAEVFRVVVTREVAAVRTAALPPGTAAARAAAVVETFAGRALRSPRLAYALLAEPVDPKVDALRLEFRRAFTEVVTAAVADGVASGELPPQDCAVTGSALVGAIGEVLVGPLAAGGADAADGTVTAIVEFALRGMGAVNVHA